jgi:hypothetical protein
MRYSVPYMRQGRQDVKKNLMSLTLEGIARVGRNVAISSLMRAHDPLWKPKLKPNFLELAAIYKEYVRMHEQSKNMSPKERVAFYGPEPDERIKQAIRDKLSRLAADEGTEQAAAGDAFFAGSLSAIGNQPTKVGEYEVSISLPEGTPERHAGNRYLLGMAEFFAQQRFGRPLHQIHFEDSVGVQDSSEMMMRILEDGHKLRYGEPVAPPKGKIDHRIILDMGLGRGLENLTNEELAPFFDEFCPTCTKTHDVDSLGRQRNAIEQQRKDALDWRPEGINPTKKYSK